MNGELAELRVALAALAPPKRFELLTLALQGERCVSELAAAVGLSQSCTTRHLQALERAGLVRGVRQGKRVLLRVEPRSVELAALVGRVQSLAEHLDVDGDVPLVPTRAVPSDPLGSPSSSPRTEYEPAPAL